MIFTRLIFIHDKEPRRAAWNMAVDEALARYAAGPTLRVYGWERPAVSFGYFGKYAQVVERWPGRELVRRWTGGGEVPHGDDLTYAIVVPRSHPFAAISVGDSYGAIHAALARCIPRAVLASESAGSNAACFAGPVLADVVLNGCKVAGAAQRRGRFGVLHQGSVQGFAIPERLAREFADALAGEVVEGELSSVILEEASRLVETRYGSEAWQTQR